MTDDIRNKEEAMEEQRVTIVNVDVPFGRMVRIILKWMLASIPAILIMWLVIFLFGIGLAGCASIFRR